MGEGEKYSGERTSDALRDKGGFAGGTFECRLRLS